MTTSTLPAPGTTARFDLDSGDRYTGEVVEIQGNRITLRNYAAWFAGDYSPTESKYADDQVRFAIDAKTRITTF